ncbi:hypothetical protein EVJ27_03460 [Exiguobacterium sp. SH3S2]|uniref:hypothetical protein n=1 Tax=unclassified Exiguobacterium TaxID=2644629 RepID=UPI00103D37A3|nr:MULTISPECIES: hypothetical protein [unclassified Exiguobacterium]TCI47195.1 hypothetical protein EVJ28_03455 [Exiguobacterium sp. SH3S3]TCI51841.1 hypothetical protein EVJ30_10845 [Exiguobacterium sp. SH5S13]TCI62297.1 hypothetical protein EVJ26_08905 [Exiguobacterium sp. SH3S1]TCI62343.1 hypothetical protein EVJ27_03460 [Exiguobacterium sp. SH3S2]
MGNFFVNLALFYMMVSPAFAYRVGRKRVARMNIITLLLYIVSWGYVLEAGTPSEHPVSILWGVLLFLNLLLAVITSAMFLYERRPNRSLLYIGVTAIIFFLGSLLVTYSLDSRDILWEMLLQASMTTVVLFVTSVIWIRLRQVDRQPEM